HQDNEVTSTRSDGCRPAVMHTARPSSGYSLSVLPVFFGLGSLTLLPGEFVGLRVLTFVGGWVAGGSLMLPPGLPVGGLRNPLVLLPGIARRMPLLSLR